MSYYDTVKAELTELLRSFHASANTFDANFKSLEQKELELVERQEVLKQMAKERQVGFPVLAKAYDDFLALQDRQIIDFLKYKDKPALGASEIVSKYSKLRREKRKKFISIWLIIMSQFAHS